MISGCFFSSSLSLLAKSKPDKLLLTIIQWRNFFVSAGRDDRNRRPLDVGRPHPDMAEIDLACVRIGALPRVVPVEEVPLVQQRGGVHAHDDAARPRLTDGVPEPAHVIRAVREADGVHTRRQVERVVGVEVTTEHAFIEALQPNDLASYWCKPSLIQTKY